jgi:hypothetical protein
MDDRRLVNALEGCVCSELFGTEELDELQLSGRATRMLDDPLDRAAASTLARGSPGTKSRAVPRLVAAAAVTASAFALAGGHWLSASDPAPAPTVSPAPVEVVPPIDRDPPVVETAVVTEILLDPEPAAQPPVAVEAVVSSPVPPVVIGEPFDIIAYVPEPDITVTIDREQVDDDLMQVDDEIERMLDERGL